MKSRFLTFMVLSIPYVIWLILYLQGMEKLPYTTNPKRYITISDIFWNILPSLAIGIAFLCDGMYKEYYKHEFPTETKMERNKRNWFIAYFTIPYTLIMLYAISTQSYSEHFRHLIYPILMFSYGNFSQLTPFNAYDLFTTKETCSSEIIWKKVFRTRGVILWIWGLMTFGIILVSTYNFENVFFFVLALIPIVWIQTWSQSLYLYRQENKNTR